MMSRIILERNYDAQIEDAFRWCVGCPGSRPRLPPLLAAFIIIWYVPGIYWQPENLNFTPFKWTQFRCFDKNGIGTISRQDLHAVFENLGERLVDDEIEGLLDEADVDSEGVITYSDFCAFKNLIWNECHWSKYQNPMVSDIIWQKEGKM